MTPQQQMQLMAMYEEQARMMAQIFNPQQFGMGLGGPAMNPAFAGMPGQQPGGSLFDRVEPDPQRQNGNFQKKPPQNGGGFNSHTKNGVRPNGADVANDEDISSSMEVESSQPTASPDTTCKYNWNCTQQDCPYAHQSPAAPAGAPIDVSDTCKFGTACQNRKCTGRHPSPAQKVAFQIEQDCKYFPNCTNPHCTFRHPSTPVCKFGAACTRPDCRFIHPTGNVKNCKFNPCLNPECPFKHAEGQKRGKFGDKVWTAEQSKEHVSDRKFVDDEMKDEELVLPGATEDKTEDHGAGSQPLVLKLLGRNCSDLAQRLARHAGDDEFIKLTAHLWGAQNTPDFLPVFLPEDTWPLPSCTREAALKHPAVPMFWVIIDTVWIELFAFLPCDVFLAVHSACNPRFVGPEDLFPLLHRPVFM